WWHLRGAPAARFAPRSQADRRKRGTGPEPAAFFLPAIARPRPQRKTPKQPAELRAEMFVSYLVTFEALSDPVVQAHSGPGHDKEADYECEQNDEPGKGPQAITHARPQRQIADVIKRI